MCTGVEIALIAGAVISAAGTVVGMQQQAQQAGYARKVAEQQAAQQRQAAMIEEDRQRRAGARLQGSQRAALAASGVDPGEGTPLLVQESTAGDVEFNALLARATGVNAAQRTDSEAELWGMKRRAAIGAIPGAIGTTLLSAGAAYGYNRTPNPNTGALPAGGGTGGSYLT